MMMSQGSKVGGYYLDQVYLFILIYMYPGVVVAELFCLSLKFRTLGLV